MNKPSERCYEMMRHVDAILADGSIEEAGIVLAYLLAKWLTAMPGEARDIAMAHFAQTLDRALTAWKEERAREEASKGRVH